MASSAFSVRLAEGMQPLPEGRILLAFSGGPDSLGLAAALRGREVLLAYVDHRMRGARDSREERARVDAAAGRLGLPLVRARLPLGLAGEAAARQERYGVLRRLAERHSCTAVATAHSADDRAETILLNLLRGTGLRGLAALPARASFGGLLRLRPAIDERRSSLRAWGEPFGPASVDRTNRSTAHARSRVRTLLLPALARLLDADPAPFLCALAGAAELLRRALEERAEMLRPGANRRRLLEEPGAAFPYLVEAVRRGEGVDGPPLTARAYSALRAFLAAGRGGALHATGAGDAWLLREGGRIGVSSWEFPASRERPGSSSQRPPPARPGAPS